MICSCGAIQHYVAPLLSTNKHRCAGPDLTVSFPTVSRSRVETIVDRFMGKESLAPVLQMSHIKHEPRLLCMLPGRRHRKVPASTHLDRPILYQLLDFADVTGSLAPSRFTVSSICAERLDLKLCASSKCLVHLLEEPMKLDTSATWAHPALARQIHPSSFDPSDTTLTPAYHASDVARFGGVILRYPVGT